VSGNLGDLSPLLDAAGCVASREHCDQQYYVLYQIIDLDIVFSFRSFDRADEIILIFFVANELI